MGVGASVGFSSGVGVGVGASVGFSSGVGSGTGVSVSSGAVDGVSGAPVWPGSGSGSVDSDGPGSSVSGF